MKTNGAIKMPTVACRISPKRTLTGILTMQKQSRNWESRKLKWGMPVWISVFYFLFSALALFAQPNVTPAQYLASQPKPNFAPGNHLPVLTTWGISPGSNAVYELANNWGYAVPLCLYFPYATPDVASNSVVPGTEQYGQVQLVKSNPTKFKLSVRIDRWLPTNVPNAFWSTNSAGLFIDWYSNSWTQNIYTGIYPYGGWQAGSTNSGTYIKNSGNFLSFYPWVSPEAPDDFMITRTEYQMKSLRMIQSNCPIAVVLNGGEYDLQCAGWGGNVWLQDARVQVTAVVTNPYARITNGTWTIVNTNGMSWPRYASQQKAHQLGFLTAAIKQQLPNRELYIFYNTGNEQYRNYTGSQPDFDTVFDQWGWQSAFMNTNTDLPSFEDYYGGLASWTNNPPPAEHNYDLLTAHLNAVGFDINLGYKTNYSWVCGGWSQTDTNALSDIPRYTGFLKCLYTAGMNGAVAGYFSNPVNTNPGSIFGGPGFNAAFPSNSPPHWLRQIMALSHVHALFSHLETFVDNSDLISGPQHHAMSYDQPAYEFTNTVADATARVLARKLRSGDQWLITAWAASGTNRNVTVNIPVLGPVTVLARDSGAVYQVTTTNTTLIDVNGMYPTASFAAALSPPTKLRVVSGGAN